MVKRLDSLSINKLFLLAYQCSEKLLFDNDIFLLASFSEHLELFM